MNGSTLQLATFAAGCFWCTEAIFKQLKGVAEIVAGYAGGKIENPTYEKVSTGRSGHAEVIQITFDPTVITFEKLLEVFFLTHDPTTLNRQGGDVGEQYRSVVFYHDEEQKRVAEEIRQRLDQEKVFGSPIVTEITPLTRFYPAEDYHQNYYERNLEKTYCQVVINPKLAKLREHFSTLLR